ncbi:hypothetical protein KIPB_009445, partial [Kipferlia bialata]
LFASDTNWIHDYDVVQCFTNPSLINCTRVATLDLLALATVLCCITVLLWSVKRGVSMMYIVIVGIGLATAGIVFLHYLCISVSWLSLVTSFSNMCQLILLSFQFGSMALRRLKRERFVKRFLVPIVVVAFLCVSAFPVIYLMMAGSKPNCTDAYWVCISCCAVMMTVLYAISCYYIHAAYRKSHLPSDILRRLTAQFIGPLIAETVSSLVSFGSDMYLYMEVDYPAQCDMFVSDPWLNAMVWMLVRSLNLLAPIWGIMSASLYLDDGGVASGKSTMALAKDVAGQSTPIRVRRRDITWDEVQELGGDISESSSSSEERERVSLVSVHSDSSYGYM